ncbi:MAG: DUF885 domain-containing protein [Oscillospiraceae bacterium]|nr:DUF885 domain-containing protein [Oscillospiraceae bacterium]
MNKTKANIIIAIVCAAAMLLLIGLALIYIYRDELFGTAGGANSPRPQDSGSVSGDALDRQPGYALPSNNDETVFDLLMDEIFLDWVTADTLTLNFSVADPEQMGIERPVPSYGQVMSAALIEEGREENENILKILEQINYANLNQERKIIYDIIMRDIEISKILEEYEQFAYYSGYICPTNGIQVQLPILLAEFSFYKVTDIEVYLALLSDTIRFFDDMIEFERERAARGYFLSEANADNVIEQLESFVANREDNLIITVFNEKIDNYPSLTSEEREDFKRRNRELVLSNVLVAYDNLIAAMYELRGVGANPGGYAALPRGDEYAYATLSLKVGTDRTADELMSLLDDWRKKSLSDVRSILLRNNAIAEGYENDTLGQIEKGTPEQYLAKLRSAMSGEFPPIDDVSYVVLEVHDSLQDYISPAFYLVPAVDDFENNVIYINPASIEDDISLFFMLAHEGYPGHMYQMVYGRQRAAHPIRALLSNLGYTEGWATYVEHLSFYWAGVDPLEAEFHSKMRMYFSFLQAQIDLGVNLFDWDKDTVAKFLYDDLMITDTEVIDSFYDAVTGLPLNMVTYSLGHIEMLLLLDEYKATYGADYNLADFHRFVLDTGPAPFPIMSEYIR